MENQMNQKIYHRLFTESKLQEGWDHDAVGPDGPISVYSDGHSSVSFIMRRNKWTYNRKKGGTILPSIPKGMPSGNIKPEDEIHFDDGNERQMTRIAQEIIDGDYE